MRACFSSKQKQRACFLKFKPFLFHNLENCGNLSSDFSCCLTSLKTSLQKSFSSVSSQTFMELEWNQSQIFKYILNFLKEKFFRRLKNRFLLLKRSDMRNWFYDRMDLSCQIAANWVHSVTNRITEKKFWRLKGPILNYGKT